MKKKDNDIWLNLSNTYYYKIFLIMKLSTLLLIAFTLNILAGNTYSQTAKISLNLKNVKVEEVLNEIEKKSEYYFLLNQKQLDVNRRVDVVVENSSIKDILANLFKNEDVMYVVYDRQIILTPKEKTVIFEMQQKVSGKVTDAIKGEAMVGVNVVVEGTTVGTITDIDGKFTINIADKNSVLVFSYIGYNTEKVAYTGQASVDVNLVLDITKLDEIIIVGYGSQKKRDIIGSITTVNMKDLKKSPSADFTSGLQGLVAGVSVQSKGGAPGDDSKILVRGANSINISTDPLWIIDGMQGSPSMSTINQNDIESIQVLKDAAATAIYGSRGAAGVIIITTKSGKKGEGSVSFNYSSGVTSLTRTPADVGYANTKEWFQVMDAAYQNTYKRNLEMDDYYSAAPQATSLITREQALTNNTNWYKELFHNGSFNDYNLSSSKGFEKGTLFLSLNYRKDNGAQRYTDLERYALRSNIDYNPTTNLTLSAKIVLGSTGINKRNSGITSMMYALPWMPVYDPNKPSQYFNPYAGSNPVASNDPANYLDHSKTYSGIAGFSANYRIPFVKGLSIRSEISANVDQRNNTNWQSRFIRKPGLVPMSYAKEDANTYQTVTYNLYGSYDKSFGKHTMNFVGGTESTRSSASFRSMEGEDLNGIFQELGHPNTYLKMKGTFEGENYLDSYFFRFNYKYKDRYMFGLSGRFDGSSKFTAKNRWGHFIAASAGWIISEEKFLKPIVGDNVFLKFRGSYGEIGNSNIPTNLDAINYTSDPTYGSIAIGGINGTLPSNIANSELKWETTKSTDIGIDFGINKNKINGSLAYYHRLVTNMLFTIPLPVSAGISESNADSYAGSANSIWSNVGNLANTGFEIELHMVNIESKAFRWTTDFNISFNKNVIKKLTPEADQTGIGLSNDKNTFGQPVEISKTGEIRYEYFIADWAGVDRLTGLPMIYALDKIKFNKNGDTERAKTISGSDSLIYASNTNIQANRFYQKGKSTDPKYYGGITNTFQFRNVDFSFMVSFSGGNYILDYDRQLAAAPYPTALVLKDIYDNSWKTVGDISKYPQLVAKGTYKTPEGVSSDFSQYYVFHNRELYKGDYIRLRNAQIGYTLNKTLAQKLRLQNLRVYVSASNLFTMTKYPGFDPEGAEFLYYSSRIPQLKSVIVGLDLKF